MKIVLLTRGKVALIDDEDYEAVLAFNWVATRGGKGFYAVRNLNGETLSLHRFLMKPASGNEIDHINGDGLDNRRKNLRECLHKENLRNRKKQPDTTSRFKGVSVGRSGKFHVQIEQNGEKLKLGIFASEFEAARAYDRAARIFFGSFARTNQSLGLFESQIDRVSFTKLDRSRAFRGEMSKLGIKPRLSRSA